MSETYRGEVFIVGVDEGEPNWGLSEDQQRELEEFVDSIEEDQRLVTTINDGRMVVRKLYD